MIISVASYEFRVTSGLRWLPTACCLLLTFIFFNLESHSQVSNIYWVQFNTKSANLFLPESAFLSQKAIERRTKQNIQVVENDYPVFKPYIQSVAGIADSVIHTLKWFNAITIRVADTNKLSAIRALQHVKVVQRMDIPVSSGKQLEEKLKVDLQYTAAISNTDYGSAENQTNMLRLNKLHDAGFKGKGVCIAVFDNGFTNVNQLPAYKKVFDENRVLFTYDYVNRKQNVYGEGNHGSYVFSTIAANEPGKFVGTAPEADFLLFITEDNNSETIMEELHWAEAAEKADSIGADIFSTSLGYITFENDFPFRSYGDMTGNSTIITQAANIAYTKGILVINSAGNEGSKAWKYIGAPADGTDVLSIGSVNEKGVISNFSSRGPNASGQLKPEVCAQGGKVAVLDAGGFAAQSAGTSFSCPIISGSAACLMQSAPMKSAKEIKEAIIKSAHLFNTPNNDYGYGIPNFFNAYISLDETLNALLSSKDNLRVFPNPLHINSKLFILNSKEGEVKIELADLSGKEIYNKTFNVDTDKINMLPLELPSALSSGQYLLRVVTPSEKKTIRVVKTDE